MLHFMTPHSVSVLSTVMWFNTTKRTHCCVSKATVIIQIWHNSTLYVLSMLFLLFIHVYHTAISIFCRYENLNCVCSVRIWCSFLFCVVMCNVCSSHMCLSTYILWTAASMNWRVSVTQMTESIGLLLLHHVSICTLSIWCFSAERTRVHKSQKKRRQTAGSPLWKPRYCYLAVIVTNWLRDMRKV